MLGMSLGDLVGAAAQPPAVVKDELESRRLVEARALPVVSETFYAVTVERRFPNDMLPLVLDGTDAPISSK